MNGGKKGWLVCLAVLLLVLGCGGAEAGRNPNTLTLAIPSSQVLWLEAEEKWFVEVALTRAGRIKCEICAIGASE